MDIYEEMKDRVGMRELLESYGVQPVRGNNIYKCIVHSPDKNPSANIIKNCNKFHCFSADTEIITKYGIRKIGDLVGQQVEIINGNGEWETVTIKHYGKQKLHKITLCRGGNKTGKMTKEIYTTNKHRWFIKTQSKVGFEEKTTDELKIGNTLLSTPTKCEDIKFDIDGIRHGFIYGDGFKRVGGKEHIGIACFYTKPKEKVMKYFENCRWRKHACGQFFYRARYRANRPLTQLPTTKDTHEYILGFLAGYFAADGSFGKGICRISCANKEELEKVRDLCVYEKIMCKKIVSQYRLGINGVYSSYYYFSVVASSLPKGFDLTERFKEKQTTMNYIHWKVLNVEETNRIEDVYCCETSTRSFVLADNILTGNCFSCHFTGDIFDVVEHFEKCDRKQALKVIDTRFNLGLMRQLTHKEKLELARQQKLREKAKAEKLAWERFEKQTLAEIVKELRVWEKVQKDTHITRGEYRRGEWKYADLFFYALERQQWLNWLYETLCGYTDKRECEFDYVYGTNKEILLKKIKNNEIYI